MVNGSDLNKQCKCFTPSNITFRPLRTLSCEDLLNSKNMMARLNVTFFIILFMGFRFVENAPSNKKNAKQDEFHTRLVFIEGDDDSTVNNDSKLLATLTPPAHQLKSISSRSMQAMPVFNQISPFLANQPSKPTDLPTMDDERQNWGIIVDDKDLPEDESYYNRPLAIPKVSNAETSKNATPKKVQSQLAITRAEASTVTKPSACDTAIVTCCTNLLKVKSCFESNGCITVTDDMFSRICSKDNVEMIIDNIASYYKMPLTN